jgi:hypothetical protein
MFTETWVAPFNVLGCGLLLAIKMDDAGFNVEGVRCLLK